MKRLQTRMLLLIFVPTILFFIGMTAYVSFTTHNMVQQDAENILQATGDSLARELQVELEKPLRSVQTLSNYFAGMIERDLLPSRENAHVMLQQLFEQIPGIESAWMFWDVNAFDGKDEEYANTEGHDHTGRFIPVWTQTESGDFMVEPIVEYDTESDTADNLNSVLQSGELAIWEPYIYELQGEKKLITSIVAPVVINGKTLGMSGVDISLDNIHAVVSEYSFYNTGFAGLLSNEGNVISHRNEELIDTNYFESDAMKVHERNDKVKEAVHAGEKMMIEGASNLLKTEVYRLFIPIEIDGIATPWSAFLSAPVDEVAKEAKQLTTTIIISSAAVTVILAGLILFVTRSIVFPIRSAVSEGHEMAKGNFMIEMNSKMLKRKDEIGDLARIFTTISESMRELIGRVQDSSKMVLQSANAMDEGANQSASAANEVATAIEEISQAAEEQMQSAEESAKAMEDMSEGVQRVAHSASAVSETANDVTEQANEGQETVRNAVMQMEQIQKETNATKEVIEQLQTDAEQIESIVSMITDISEQTNLLALNAAIEAARAGEAGQGFAVVADEVRKLADETKESAHHIQQIVETIQSHSEQATASMDANDREVKEGMARIAAVGEMFEQIIHSVQEVVSEIEDLAAVAEEMSSMSEEVAAASEEISSNAELAAGNTQQVAASAEQQLATMEEMKQTSQSLKDLVLQLHELLSQFRVS